MILLRGLGVGGPLVTRGFGFGFGAAVVAAAIRRSAPFIANLGRMMNR